MATEKKWTKLLKKWKQNIFIIKLYEIMIAIYQ